MANAIVSGQSKTVLYVDYEQVSLNKIYKKCKGLVISRFRYSPTNVSDFYYNVFFKMITHTTIFPLCYLYNYILLLIVTLYLK